MIKLYAARWVPPLVQGLVRDLRVRWALEEAGLAYDVVLLNREEWSASASYRALQPFGQIPAYEEDGLRLFESGAIALHIARKSPALLPEEPEAQAHVITWMFAALNSVEPPLQTLTMMDLFNAREEWAKMRRPGAIQAVERRLDDLAAYLKERTYLTASFSVADVLMATVLRIPRHTDLVARRPVLASYLKRCEDRPAFRKALADQLAGYKANEPVPA
jgi:glutathione S-transferase